MGSIKSLLLKHLRAQTTVEEQMVIDAWLAASEANRELFAELNDPELVARSLEKMDRLHEDQVWERLQAHSAGERAGETIERVGAAGETGMGKEGSGIGSAEERIGKEGSSVGVNSVHFPRRRWWVAAAVIFVLLGTGVYWVLHNRAQQQIASTQHQRFRNDVAPGRNAAILTLANRQNILLNSQSSGSISRQGNASITNAGGQLVYKELQKQPTEILYNTLTTG